MTRPNNCALANQTTTSCLRYGDGTVKMNSDIGHMAVLTEPRGIENSPDSAKLSGRARDVVGKVKTGHVPSNLQVKYLRIVLSALGKFSDAQVVYVQR